MPGKQLNVLISGGGIAGPSLGLLLSRAGHRCTIVERSSQFRQSGQQIDVSGEGLKVVQAMEIEEAIRARTVGDQGLKFVESNGQTIAEFPASSSGTSLVKEIEILRPELANVIFEATKDKVEYRFGERIHKIQQDDSGVTVTLAGSKAQERYDILVLADGLRSPTRDMVFGPDNTQLHSLGQFASFFTIPWQERDGQWSKWYNAPGGRCLCLRPDVTKKNTGAFMCQITDTANLERLAQLSKDEQRDEIIKIFTGAGWETERVIEELQGGIGKETFYYQEVAQARSKSLAKGRVVLLGDSGYCPSPVSGQGTTLALVGAYILAGCIATHDDHSEALRLYEEQMKPFVASCQKLIPGTPWIVNPQTTTGITVMSNVLWVVSRTINSSIGSGLSKLAEWLPSFGGSGPTLPDFPILQGGGGSK